MISPMEVQIEAFCQRMYIEALKRVNLKEIDWVEYKKYIVKQLKRSKIPYQKIKSCIFYSRDDWIEELLQITRDLKLVLQTQSQFRQKLHHRFNMHFGSGHYENLQKLSNKSTQTKKIISMYKKSEQNILIQYKIPSLTDSILQNTIYTLGLTKGNGIIVEQNYAVTCAHVLMDEKEKVVKYRCFATGNGSYGIIKVNQSGVFIDKDVGFGKVTWVFKGQRKAQQLFLDAPKRLYFGEEFKPIRCIQVGLLFNNESQSTQIKVFETAEGFIQRNLYENNLDKGLVEQMGLLVHDCYGLWGTSGSPLWTSQGQLLGIHNAWNENGYNISMIVHDDDTEKCRIVKQYERRAIGIHVLLALFQEWKEFQEKEEKRDKNQPQNQIQRLEKSKKKMKL